MLTLLPAPLTDPVPALFRRLFRAPLQFGYSLPSLATSSDVPTVADPELQAQRSALELENIQLHNHLATLKANLAEKDLRIAELAGARQRLGWDMVLVPADTVMALSPGHLVINRGQRDGLFPELFALDNEAVVGQLIKTNRSEAELLLVTNLQSSIPAIIYIKANDPKQSLPGMLDGTGDGLMRMRVRGEVPLNAPVHVWQPKTLDVPLIVGRVRDCRRDKEEPLLWEVVVEPATSLENIRGVEVWLPAP